MNEAKVVDEIKARLERLPSVTYRASRNSIAVLPVSDDGFPVRLTVDRNEYLIGFGEWHDHLETADDAIDWFGFGLSERCRIKVSSLGGFDYKWRVEAFRDDGWQELGVTGLLLFPFWRRRRQRYLQNRFLPRTFESW